MMMLASLDKLGLMFWYGKWLTHGVLSTGKQRKNRSKEFRGTAKTKGAKKEKK
jgi:hypothetical protein